MHSHIQKEKKISIHSAYLHGMKSWTRIHEWAELVDTAFCFRQQNFGVEGRILLQTVTFYFRWPHLGSDGRILLQMAVFCLGRSHFASDGRVLLQTAAFCFGPLHSASEGSVLRHTAMIAFGSPLKASEKKYFALCNEQCALTLQKDVMYPYTMRCLY